MMKRVARRHYVRSSMLKNVKVQKDFPPRSSCPGTFPRRLNPLRAHASQPQEFEVYLLATQEAILQELASLDDSGVLKRDPWERKASSGASSTGYGLTAVFEGPGLLEKAACNSTIITGSLSAARAKAITARGTGVREGERYSAKAVSIVVHPGNPHVPTLRADVRQFQVEDITWFGGGCDLTPAYLYPDDARAFHQFWRNLCSEFRPELYLQMKHACDAYFYLPARAEHRGIGGIFFDDLCSDADFDAEQFARAVLDGVMPSWQGIAATRGQQSVTPEQRAWQLQRRARYIEFNLLYDRGVKFGLEGGRVESVLVSAPPLVAWPYDVQPPKSSPEAALVDVLKQPQDWA